MRWPIIVSRLVFFEIVLGLALGAFQNIATDEVSIGALILLGIVAALPSDLFDN